MHFKFINVVWGTSYTRLFIDVSLPFSLSPNNLGSIPKNADCEYCIYTTDVAGKRIRESSPFQQLQSLVRVRFLPLQMMTDHYKMMAVSHQHALKNFSDGNTSLVFLCPDLIIADGSLKRLFSLVNEGKKAVMISGTRLSLESLLPDLGTYLKAGGIISPRNLVREGLNHLHHQTCKMFWSNNAVYHFPAHVNWRVGTTGFITHPFHIHPLLIVPQKGTMITSTVDDDLFLKACIEPDEVKLITDSDDICVFEFSSDNQHDRIVLTNVDPVEYVANWAKAHTNSYHREYFRTAFKFHSEDLNDEWVKVEEASSKIVNAILRGPEVK